MESSVESNHQDNILWYTCLYSENKLDFFCWNVDDFHYTEIIGYDTPQVCHLPSGYLRVLYYYDRVFSHGS